MRQATELARLAVKSNDEVIAATYLEMARVWLKLAQEVRLSPVNDDRRRSDDEDDEALRG